jgi:hypothetical protein
MVKGEIYADVVVGVSAQFTSGDKPWWGLQPLTSGLGTKHSCQLTT